MNTQTKKSQKNTHSPKTLKLYAKNANYQKFEVLKLNRNKRYKYNQFFVEGVRNINEAVKNNWKISSFIYTEQEPLSDWASSILNSVETETNYILTPELLSDLSSKTDTSELLAVVEMREDDLNALEVNDSSIFLLFDRPSNKGNLGTVIRSCDAFGIDGLLITGHAVDLYDPDVLSASMGSFFALRTVRVTDNQKLSAFLDKTKAAFPHFKTIGTTAHQEKPLYEIELSSPLVLMIGNETDGLSRAYKESCDLLTTIPMSSRSSASSLNVACAATVLMYEIRKSVKP